jgi:ferric-dicitrate binding protein FerR (iron transport regulator)
MNQELLDKYIAGDASAEERVQVYLWAKSDENNLKELQALHTLYNITVWRQEEARIANPHRQEGGHRLFFYRIAVAVAVFIVLSGTGLYLFNRKQTLPEVMMQTIRVPAGQRVEMELIDGTKVWLNAGTTFIFPNQFHDGTRSVFLDGEACFAVTKNEKQRFQVKTASFEINVTGTEFNVFAYSKSPQLFEVDLLEGTVEVNAPDKNKRISLTPNTRAWLSDNTLVKGKILNYNKLLWKDGLICFDNESVIEMVAKLELYFDTQIIVRNDAFKTKRYTGKFRTKDGIEHILKVFQLKDRFVYEKNEENNVITIR